MTDGKNTTPKTAPQVISRKDAKALGLTRFFTGRPCIKGHTDERLVSNAHCVVCGSRKAKLYQVNNPDKMNSAARDRMAVLRREALETIGSGHIACVECGCDQYECLEINHKNGGGAVERRIVSRKSFYRRVITGARAVDDLEITCKVCNARHALEMKFGPLPFEIKWKLQHSL